MPNVFYRARALYRSGEREIGFAVLHDYLSDTVGETIFNVRSTTIQLPVLDSLEMLIAYLMENNRSLMAPFGATFAALWRLAPLAAWLAVLKNRDLRRNENFLLPEALGINDREWDYTDLKKIGDVLESSARLGILSPLDEGPNSGRIALPIAEVKKVDTHLWGTFAHDLSVRLADAYANCPLDFWQKLAQSDAQLVLERFLHDLFSDWNQGVETVQIRWAVIQRDFPEYARAVEAALKTTLSTKNREQLNDIVAIDAGFDPVADGAIWLLQLTDALQSGDFISLYKAPKPGNDFRIVERNA